MAGLTAILSDFVKERLWRDICETRDELYQVTEGGEYVNDFRKSNEGGKGRSE